MKWRRKSSIRIFASIRFLNHCMLRDSSQDAASYDYHLSAASPRGGSGVVDAGGAAGTTSNGEDLTAVYQYVYDAQAIARTAVGSIDIGAFELSDAAVRPLPPQNLKVVQ